MLRLRFVQSSAQLQAAGGSTGKGYELVTVEDNDSGTNGGDIELGRAVAAAKAAEAPISAKETPMPTSTTPSSSSKGASQAKFASIASANDPNDKTVAL